MTVAILGIVGTILGAAWFLARRKIENADTPEQIAIRRREEVARNLVNRDSVRDSVRVGDLLRSLQSSPVKPRGDNAKGETKDDRAA